MRVRGRSRMLAAVGAAAFVALAAAAIVASQGESGSVTLEPRPERWEVRPGERAEVALLLKNAGDAPVDVELVVTPKGILRVGDEYLAHSRVDTGWLSLSPERRSVRIAPHGETLVPFTLVADAAATPAGGGHAGFTLRWTEDGRAFKAERNVGVASLDPPPVQLGPLLVVGALGLAGGGLLLALRRVDWRLVSGTLAAPLYSRIRRSDALENERRRAIVRAIEETPGIHVAELGRRTRLPNGALHHHLRILRQSGLVTSRREHGRRVYALTGAAPREADPLSPAERRLLELLPAQGIAAAELAARLGITRQGVYYHAQRLAERGLLRKEETGDGWRYFRA